MMHPLCLSVVEKSIKDKKTDIQNIIRNRKPPIQRKVG